MLFFCAASESHREVYASLGVPSQQGVYVCVCLLFCLVNNREKSLPTLRFWSFGPTVLGFTEHHSVCSYSSLPAQHQTSDRQSVYVITMSNLAAEEQHIPSGDGGKRHHDVLLLQKDSLFGFFFGE